MKNKLPNFLIVGAAKSGTTSLHNYLNQHPDVFMPSYNKKGMKVKEPRFLIKDLVKERLHNGIWSWHEYQALFNTVKNQKAIGESTVLYLYYYELAIKNIQHYLGRDVKIIIMLRDPSERAFSAYTHVSRGRKENLSFKEALLIEDQRLLEDPFLTPMIMYKDMGLYYKMVKSYLDSFEHVHVIFYEDFKNNTANVVAKTLEFLDIDSSFEINTKKRYNIGGKRWKNKMLKKFFTQDNFIKQFFRIITTHSFRKKIRIITENIMKKKTEPMSKDIREELVDFFNQDISQLETLLKVNLKTWKK